MEQIECVIKDLICYIVEREVPVKRSTNLKADINQEQLWRLLVALEEAFDIDITDDDEEEMQTVDQLIKLIEQKTS